MNDSFFGKNGTIQGLMNFTDEFKNAVAHGYQDLQGMKSDNSMDRLGSLGKIVSAIVAMCCA